MCGLFGCMTKKGFKLTKRQNEVRINTVKALGIAMEDRGNEATGLAIIKNEKTRVIKKAMEASDFLRKKNVNDALASKPEIVMGHTRLATSGLVTDKNSHPFLKGNIVGAHNGHVSNHLEIDGKAQVDSEVIFSLLNKNKNDYVKTLKRLSGNFAITWLNTKQPNDVYFVTHINPLATMLVPEIKTLFWASTEEALVTIIPAAFGLEKRTVWSLEDDYVYKINSKLHLSRKEVEFKSMVTNYQHVKNCQCVTCANDSGFDNNWEDEQYLHHNRGGYNPPPPDEVNEGSFKDGEDEPEEEEEETPSAMQLVIEGESCAYCQQAIIVKKGFWWSNKDSYTVCGKCYFVHKLRGSALLVFINYKKYLDLKVFKLPAALK